MLRRTGPVGDRSLTTYVPPGMKRIKVSKYSFIHLGGKRQCGME